MPRNEYHVACIIVSAMRLWTMVLAARRSDGNFIFSACLLAPLVQTTVRPRTVFVQTRTVSCRQHLPCHDLCMNLPTPTTEHVTRMQALYQAEVGVELSRDEAYDVLSRIVQFIYLTKYEAIYPLRPQEPRRREPAAAVD